MEVRLRMSGATCDGTQIYAFPSSITCTGLIGSRSYSGYLEIKYSTNPALASKQSAGTTFTTIDATQAPVISLSNSIQSIAAGTPLLIVTPTNSGGATSVNGYSISPTLPPGLSFNTNTGTISGTPTQTLSQRTYTVTAVGTGGSASATFILTITAAEIAPAISLSNSLQSVTVGNAILTVSATNSGGAISQNGFTISPSLPSGLVFSASTGSISGTPTQIASQRSYTVTAAGTGGSANAIFTLTVIAADIAPVISLSNSVQSVTAGNPILSVNATNTGGTLNSNGYSISPTLPSGLVFSTSNGSISGTPTQVQGAQNYSVTATGKAGSSTATFTLAVTAPVSAPVISISNPVQSVTVGNSILTVSPTNSGGAISSNGYSISPALPTGLTLNTSIGSISGIPTSVQAQTNYTVTAVGLGGAATAVFTLTVLDNKAPVLVANSTVLVARLYSTDSAQAVTFRATDNVGVSDAFIQVFNSTNVLMGTYAANRISGTALDGIYASSFYFDPIFYPSGTYQVKVRLGNVASKVLDWQLIGSIQVVAPADTQNPVVGGTLVSGLAINGTFKGTLGIPLNFKPGGYLVCAIAIDAANLRSANQCGSRAEYVQIGVIEVVDASSIYVLTGWEVSGLNGSTVTTNSGLNFEIKTLDRSNTFVISVVAKSDSGSPDIIAYRFWKSRSEQPGTLYPDNWQALFNVPSNVIVGSIYKIYWTIKQSNGNTGTYVGGDFVIGG